MERAAMILPMESQLFKLCIGCTCLPANICVGSSKKIYFDKFMISCLFRWHDLRFSTCSHYLLRLQELGTSVDS
jgi:hypothetical protein